MSTSGDNHDKGDPAAIREQLGNERKKLWEEHDVLRNKEELGETDVKRILEIQTRVMNITKEIEESMQLSLQRSELLQAHDKRTTSTPANRCAITFNEESLIHQALDTSSLSKNLMHIESYKPAEGSDAISTANYRRWRKMLMRITEALNEEEKESFFLRSAGPYLMDICEMLADQQPDTGESETPFSDTILSLDKYFDSDGVKNEARAEFESMKRNTSKNESNVAYLDRLARAAKNCGFPHDEIDKKLMTVVARNIDDEGIRKAAIEVDFNGKYRTYSQFRNHLRHLDLIQSIGLNQKKGQWAAKQEVSVHALEGDTQAA